MICAVAVLLLLLLLLPAFLVDELLPDVVDDEPELEVLFPPNPPSNCICCSAAKLARS